MQNNIDCLFSIPIYTATGILEEEEKKILYNKVLEQKSCINNDSNWNCNTIHSLGKIDLRDDPVFFKINEKITECVNQFSCFFNSEYEYKINSCWFNIAEKNTFQEYHIHKDSVFSAVYYLSCPSGSGEIVFQNPNDRLDMKSIPNIVDTNRFNCSYHYYSPNENSLLIFRSYLYHMVRIGKNEDPRISLAYNFS